ncbi:MAG: hypothetical protein IKU37_03735 [Candidatus Gastranaerophilales bacterium]|nr:hypothetical protein [Candidatus Gastranaerophilales bacterium]
MTSQIKLAKDYFYQRKYKEALEIFDEIQDYYSAGLCSLLLKDKSKAFEYWKKSCSYSPASVWGLAVLDLINLKVPKKNLSFFQTRAQLEIYINLFLENGLIEWTQNIVSMCDILHQANPESYKFIARALYSNGYFDLAITFCKKTLKLYYCDPEAFLILSQCYYLIGNLGEALDCVNRVNAMVDDYFPAIVFRQILKEEIKKKHEL